MNFFKTPSQSDIKMICGNAIELLADLKDNSIDLFVTDPPYKITARGTAGTTGGILKTDISLLGKIFEHNDISPTEYAELMYSKLKDSGHCYIMSNHVNLQSILNAFTNAGFHFIKSLIWYKDNKIVGRFYMSQFEYILFFRKGEAIPINECGTSDVLSIANIKPVDSKGNILHPTPKPSRLMEILIRNSSKEGELVCDPFAGLFSTAIACKKLNRNFIGFEIDKHYYNIAKDLIDGKQIQDVNDY